MTFNKTNIEAIYPLSPMQQGMLFHSLLEPDSGVYVEQLECTFRGKLDVTAFERAWQRVVDEHGVLRTGFFSGRLDRPLQIVSRALSVSPVVEDWRGLAAEEQARRWATLLADDRRRGFDLTTPPLMRLALVRTADDRHRCVWTFHHILLDGWSLPLILQKVLAGYGTFSAGEVPALEASRPYRDYIAWLQGQDMDKAEAHWRALLAGFDAPTPLTVDRALSGQPAGYAEDSLELSAETTTALNTLAQGRQLTVSTLLQGAWAVLLSRYSATRDVVFGITVSGRPAAVPGVEDMVGLFINTLPLRVAVAPDATLGEWLQALQAQNVALQDYQYSPLTAVQGWSEVSGGAPLFESIVVFENYPVDAALGHQSVAGVEVHDVRVQEQTNYPLTLVAVPGARLSLRLSYDRQRFEPATITRLLGHLRMLLEGMVASPGARLGDLPLLTAVETKQLLVDWNATRTDFPGESCIHQLFEQQVEQTPEATALVFEERALSYAELNARGNQLAHHLRTLGVGPDVLVGICAERSIEMVVGLLGILKAGGAYVPLDPAYPKERLAFMLEDTQAPVLLTQERLLGGLPREDGTAVLRLDTDSKSFSDCSVENPVNQSRPESLAYVIYTSGSTGRPKGVSIPHQAVNRLVFDTNYITLSPQDRVAQVSNSSFDAATFELWSSLLLGCRLHIISKDILLSLREFAAEVTAHEISALFLTTALFNQLAQTMPDIFRNMRYVLFGGEAVEPKWVDAVLKASPPQRLLHVYGPTESTTFATWTAVASVPDGATNLPIGRPIANTQLYILDAEYNPTPVSVPGELYIGGAGLARGYLNRPQLTAETFIPNPFSDTPGERLYKTGDLVRYLPDGNIEFLGRLDHQIKIRGFRIEIGEIETTLARAPGVHEAVVMAREETSGDKRLVAYVVSAEGQQEALEVGALREFLKGKLPDYMVPSGFVFLDGLPLTPNGKVDRKGLPAPEGRLESSDGYVAPRTPTEELLAGIWVEVLGQVQVGAHDNFFALGGHSLLAIQLVSRVRDTFGVELPVRDVFERPTVAELGEAIDAGGRGQQGALPPLAPVTRDGELPLSFAQERLWFLDQLEGANAVYNMPAALRLDGALDRVALEQSLAEIVRRHESLRTTFAKVNGVAVQVIAPETGMRLPVVDLQGLSAEEQTGEVQRLAAEEALAPFDLGRGPLLRGKLLRLGPAAHVALLTMHHIVSDGWSVGVFIRELSALYQAFVAGKRSPLPALPIQYADYAHWQRQWLSGEVLAEQLTYWREQLAGAPALLELPTDRVRPPVQSFRGATERFSLDAGLTQGLKALGQRYGVTLFMSLLTGFMTLLARYSRQEDIVVGSPVANRNQSETEALIGFFVNTLVLRGDLSGNPTFNELLGRVRQTALAAYAHQEVPFEQVVETLQPERNLSHSPLFQVMFVLQSAPEGALELPQVTLSPLTLESVTAKFDLTLSLSETAEGLEGAWEYNTDLFDAATIRRMVGHFRTLLEGIVAHPEQRVSELPLLTEAERQQLLLGWNPTETDCPRDRNIHQLFEQQVEKIPEATAVVFEDQSITYAELNARANQLAHHLGTLGVGPDVLVGLCVERSLELVIGLLGILKAGGAYVPLDPAYPKARITYTLEDCAAPVLVTQASSLGELSWDQGEVVCLDRDWGAIGREPETNPAARSEPQHLAYAIYTSGSTGTPKGALVTHRNVTRLFAATESWYNFGPDDVWTLFHSSTFDFSVWEIWGALLYGGRLIVVPYLVSRSPEDFHRLLRDERVTVLNQTPRAFYQLIEVDEKQRKDELSLRLVIFGGEALDIQRLRAWFGKHGDAKPRLVNMYGITETTVHVTYRPITMADVDRRVGSVIGSPIPDLKIYVVDSHLNPVPVGVPGELCVGGQGVVRGYLNRPELTAEKFISSPFQEGDRLYRSGDLVRFLSDGDLEYLGRIDHQVKIRGFRIELGEIETLLSQHAGVRETVVLARQDGPGEKRLVAYVVVTPEAARDVSVLRAFLKEKLPDYMVPSAFVFLDGLPLTPNGKVDRKGLPAPEGRLELVEAYVVPRTPEEERLAGIWAEVLGVERVGIHDNFFELGGDSILSIQVVARANQAGLQLAVRQLFEQQTVAGLAAVAGSAVSVQAEQGPVTGRVPLTPIQRWFLDADPSVPQHFNQSLLLEVHTRLQPTVLEAALAQLLQHHDALRMRFHRGAGGWQQVNGADEPSEFFTHIDLSSSPASERAAALEASAARLQASLALESGPLMRAALFHLGAEEPDRLLLIIHHLVVDGVSWRILLEDLQSAYRQFEAAQTVVLPPKTSSFKQWAERLQAYAQRDGGREGLGYWTGAAGEPAWALPLDNPEGDNTVATARTVTVSLTAGETQALLQQAPEAYRTRINDLLLTALAQTLAGWSGRDGIWVDLEGHGREPLFEDIDLTRTVGWFTTLFPVRLDLAGAAGPGAAIKAVKEQLRQVPGNGLEYGVGRYLSAEPELQQALAAVPQPPISFNYLGQFDQLASDEALFRPADEAHGREQDEQGLRGHVFDVVGSVLGGELSIRWIYSAEQYRGQTVEALAQGFIAALRELFTHCLSPEAGGYTPSDFPDAALSQHGLDRLTAAYLGEGSGTRTGRTNIEAIYPLSPTQQGMLFHSLLEPDSGVYVEQLECTFRGKLDEPALERAWQRVVDEHGVLRTGFFSGHLDRPLQIVSRALSVLPVIEDWRDLAAEEQARRWDGLLADDRRRGFDLTTPPLMRLTLVRTADDCHRFLWSHHHVLLDGWSLPLILQKVLAGYAAFSAGEVPAPEAPRPYRDYIAWLQGQDVDQAEAHWRALLAGFDAPTPLTVDRALSGQPAGYAEDSLELSAETTTALNTLAQGRQLTVSTLLQGAWAVVLSRYSAARDVVFGITVSGRPATLQGVEDMVGLFINTLPLRVAVAPDATLGEWLQALQAQNVALQDYQYSPLTAVQGWSEVPGGTPLFESIVVFENYPVDAALGQQHVADLEVHDIRAQEQTNYPLTLVVGPGARLSLRLSYDRQRFEPATITRLLGHLRMLLEGMAAGPGARLGDLPLLTAVETKQLLVDWNATRTDFPGESCIHQLFEQQVAQTPEATALVFEDRALTYAELNARANQLAHHLRTLGVGPDVLVGICAERSIEMVVGLLGILKAGGAYVPLDPDYPKDRLGDIMAGAGAPVVLIQSRLRERLPSTDAQVLALDAQWERIARAPEINPAHRITPGHLAYVIYTSGSTGRPKGVAIPHAGILNRLLWMQDAYGLDASDRVLQKTPFSFDVSVWEFFWPLITGASLVVAKPGGHRDSAYLAELIAREQITTLHFVPPMLAAFLEEPGIAACLSLRRVICSGEALPLELMQRHYARLAAPLHNLYGPTEASVDVTYWACEHDTDLSTVPIGRPIANTQMYILDAELNPVPVGVAGELHIGGVNLARGYLDRPDLTAEKFIPDPFGGTPGARLYKTGDLSRFLPDGNIEFLGRIDHQVKIRGFRIELGEIETLLSQHAGVRETVVLARQDGPGEKRLVAYVVVTPEAARDVSVLRAFLKEKLPDYMVPSAFVFLDGLPLTPNGKVDRKGLPAPEGRLELVEAYVVPRTPEEERLAGIWAEVLGVERVGIHDNFFELGGDSILSIQVVARANQAGLQLAVRQLFEQQTVAGLAAVAGSAVSVQAEQGPVTGRVPLTPIQRWFLDADPSVPQHFNQSLLLEVHTRLQPTVLEAALAQLLQHHDALRMRFHRDAEGWQQVNGADEPSEFFTHIDLSSSPAPERAAALEASAARLQASLALESGPLMRAALFHLGAEEPDRLLLIIHHLVVDGVSWRILLEDLQSAYRQFEAAQTVVLPPKTSSFKQWAERLQAYAQRDGGREGLGYWTGAAGEPAWALPLDNPEGDNTVATARTVTVSLTAEETQALLQQAPEAYRTQINDLLLTALAQTFSGWSGRDGIWVDLEGHGREPLFEDIDLTRTVGWFTTLFPVRLDLAGAAGPGGAIKAIKEQLRQVPGKGLEYGVGRYLSDEPALTQALAAVPQPPVSFNYLGQFDQLVSDEALFRPADEAHGREQDEQGLRGHVFDVVGSVLGGELSIRWIYSAEQYRGQTVEALAQAYITALRELIAHCLSPEAGGYTPSDFPDAALSDDDSERTAQDDSSDARDRSFLPGGVIAAIQQRSVDTSSLATPVEGPTADEPTGIGPRDTDADGWMPLIPVQPQGSLRPFFCVPGTGANVNHLHALARSLRPDQPMYGFEPKGLDGELEPHTRIEDMARDYIEALRNVQPEGPYLLGGHSLGGWVAFEMAQQLLKQGQDVSQVAILDAHAPSVDYSAMDDDWDDVHWLEQIVKGTERATGKRVNVSYDELRELQPLERIDHIARRLQTANVIPAGIGAKHLHGYFQVFKASSNIRYVPRDVISAPIAFFRALEASPVTTFSDQRAEIVKQRDWGWSRFALNPVEPEFVPGDHHTMLNEPNAPTLAKRLKACLRKSGTSLPARDSKISDTFKS